MRGEYVKAFDILSTEREEAFEHTMAGESFVSDDDDYDEALGTDSEAATSDDDIAKMAPIRREALHWLLDSHRYHGHGAQS